MCSLVGYRLPLVLFKKEFKDRIILIRKNFFIPENGFATEKDYGFWFSHLLTNTTNINLEKKNISNNNNNFFKWNYIIQYLCNSCGLDYIRSSQFLENYILTGQFFPYSNRERRQTSRRLKELKDLSINEKKIMIINNLEELDKNNKIKTISFPLVVIKYDPFFCMKDVKKIINDEYDQLINHQKTNQFVGFAGKGMDMWKDFSRDLLIYYYYINEYDYLEIQKMMESYDYVNLSKDLIRKSVERTKDKIKGIVLNDFNIKKASRMYLAIEDDKIPV